MNIKTSIENRLYSPKEREEILNKIIEITKQDNSIVGTIIVGSGAEGFRDEYSDIDLCVVIKNDADILKVYRDFAHKVNNQLEVFKYVEVLIENKRYLHLFLLDNFLELDISFVYLKNLAALRNRWKVSFDNSGKIEEIMQRTWNERKNWNGKKDKVDIKEVYINHMEDIWYNIIHGVISVKRKDFWRALYELEYIRNITIELHGLREGLETKRFRYVDKMSHTFREDIEKTLVSSMDSTSLLLSINNAATCFFKEAQYFDSIIGKDYSSTLRNKINEFLDIIRRI